MAVTMILMSPAMARHLLGPRTMPAPPYQALTLAGQMISGQYSPASGQPVTWDSAGNLTGGIITLAAVIVTRQPQVIPVTLGGGAPAVL